ncbi:hypothetical protein niasHS_017758 [Heterodera schachtii]|uniref:Cap-specific mRNA (nucleoside-2'-O-)-methyltransferase 1 n=1 Tax=Heterodera schachtii TaxID=97005 RepID=A0ABD2HWP9_HETSC
MDYPTDQKARDDNKAMKIMERMGFAHGEGLGKNKQGITAPIELRSRIGRRGLGIETEQQHKEFESFLNNELENKPVEEAPEWLKCDEEQRNCLIGQLSDSWIMLGAPITKDEQLMKQDRYCPSEQIAELIEAKNVFDTMDRKEVEAARSRANPYETVKAGFFQNRAAMKTANLDKIFDWRLSWEFDDERRLAKNPLNENERDNVDRFSPPFYFADVCAGPGGFSEYMLWRKAFYNAKGFGFTLTGKDDFKLERFKAASSDYFETFYGVNEDGDVTNPDNLELLEKFVNDRIHTGVHLVMCDGGFSVDGQENLQEVLSKRLYLCQFIVGLSLCRAERRKVKEENGEGNAKVTEKGGNFLCKLFDVFTPFSMGLIYLMYLSFDRVSLHKPITSRPANSERYIFCENLNLFGSTKVKKYLMEVNKRMESMDRKKEDIMELVPDEVISEDDTFMAYIRQSIEQTARRQVFYLRKYKHFAANPGTFDQDQAKLREEALKYWELPDIERPKDPTYFNRKRTAAQMDEERQIYQNQRPETANEMFRRYSGDKVYFPIKRQIARFTEDVLRRCSDTAELRALLMPKCDSDGPVLLVSVVGNRTMLMMHRRNGTNFEAFQSVKGTFPKGTVLLAMCTTLFEDTGKSMHPLGNCLWVLDAAVLNEDNVANFDLKARNAAAHKFAAAVNRLYVRRAIFERNPNKGRRGGMEFSCYTNDTFSELIVAEPMRLKALAEQKFMVRQYKGCRVAFFPVWARNDCRDPQNPPKKYFVECQGVRIQNVLNPNFMLTRNERNQEEVKPRPGVTPQQNRCTNFYDSFVGYFSEDIRASYPDGHPHNGAITFHWSWAPDFSSNFTVEHILNPELDHHPAGLTMSTVRRLIGISETAKKEERTEEQLKRAQKLEAEPTDDCETDE